MKLGVSVAVVFAFLCWCSVAAAAPVATTSDYDCSDFGSQAEAQEHLAPGDPDGLDADSDGIACESNPCPCSASSGAEGGGGSSKPAPPPEPPKLSKAAAKSAAMSEARKFDRRNTKVRGVRFNGCTRRGKYRINCRLSAKGKSGSEITTCNLGVVVSGEGSAANARLAPHCRSYRQLEADRAIASLRATGGQIAGKPTEVLGFRRHSLLIFVAMSRWTQTTTVNEECSVNLIAELLNDDSIEVRSRELECVAI